MPGLEEWSSSTVASPQGDAKVEQNSAYGLLRRNFTYLCRSTVRLNAGPPAVLDSSVPIRSADSR